ncbi:heparinase II/III family protein [Rhizobium sp. CSW-27]|uniref:heparinase II/III family protein n=1 Tax=Rhizobium sp. CSW-27 TaxID=2839985 RepID=UPI001C0107DC|nr:heparinase II/III family protein [Rhizobium sp. CSW-27]MBT9372708.1 heparinase II/III family protein [Rhizobium sp. CSW-27]
MLFAERRRHLALGMTEARRRLGRRITTLAMQRCRLGLDVPERLIVAPTDLRAIDPFIAEEILSGRFPLAGKLLETEGESPFLVAAPSRAFAERLHSFAWLRHMRALRNAEARARARAIATSWMNLHQKRLSGTAWQPHVTAERMIAWLSHSPVLLQGAEGSFYRRFMKSLAVQRFYLHKVISTLPEGETRLRIRIALAMASLAMPSGDKLIRREGVKLDQELERQILADGGHVSRNPRTMLELLLDLLPLRQTYINLGHDVPAKLIPAIDRIYPALRFFRHQDGDLALFNGATATPATELMSVLRYDETAGKPFKALPHSQYHRLTAGETTILVDTGTPQSADLSAGAHAGCLSFEMSAGRSRFIVNAGAPKFADAKLRLLSRATATHSTVTLGETSSQRILQSTFLGPLMASGIGAVTATRWEDAYGNDWLKASHDGYVEAFGYVHQREIGLAAKGDKIKGHDHFFVPDESGKAKHGRRVTGTARFHIHPNVGLKRIHDDLIAMATPGGDTWLFSAPGQRVEIEEDVFFADVSGIRASRQLVIAFSLPETVDLRWMLKQQL